MVTLMRSTPQVMQRMMRRAESTHRPVYQLASYQPWQVRHSVGVVESVLQSHSSQFSSRHWQFAQPTRRRVRIRKMPFMSQSNVIL